MILQRPIEREQMKKLLETGKTDLLQFVSARTRRPFAAFLVKQPDGKVGFEFEAKAPGRKGARGTRSTPLRVLGAHPRDRQPVELHAGRYGPYVKHGSTNATLPDRNAVETLSLDDAVALVDDKAGRGTTTRSTRRSVGTRALRKAPLTTAEPVPARKTPPRRPAGKTGQPAARAPVAGKRRSASRISAAKSPAASARKRSGTGSDAGKTRAVAAAARKPAGAAAAKKTTKRR